MQEGRLQTNRELTMWITFQVLLFLVMAGAAAVAPSAGKAFGFDLPVIGAFTGALVGGAATMLGGLFARLQTTGEKKSRIKKIKALITAELLNAAVGYIGMQEMLKVALGAFKAGYSVPYRLDLSNEMPRSLPFTSALGTELLRLSGRQIEILSTLEANTAITRKEMGDISAGKRPLELQSGTSLSNGVAHDMEILAEALETIAPSRKLSLSGRTEIASVILRELAKELTN